jgi:hypothetical protein
MPAAWASTGRVLASESSFLVWLWEEKEKGRCTVFAGGSLERCSSACC